MTIQNRNCFWKLVTNGHRVLLVLFCLTMGCHSDEPVTVIGAVVTQDSYPYVANKSVKEYVADAGGVTEEALGDQMYLVRAVPDSAGNLISERFDASDSLVVLPSDHIVVPAKRYAVRFDSVKTIRNLRLVSDGQIMRIPNGVLVPGWTEKGAVVAMILGRGKGYDVSDTTKVVSAFHYLYVHLHPQEYDKVTTFSAGVTDSLEALEDAFAIHQWLFERQPYQLEGEAELPPVDHFQVLQGVLLTPRTEVNPGSGFRRQRFDDGRVWTTFRDGRQRWQYPDGRVVMHFPKGNQEVRYRDGRTAYTDLQGNVRTQYTNGRQDWKLVSGTNATIYPDGRMVRTHPNGDVFRRDAEGSTYQEFHDGTKRIDYADGRVFIQENSGYAETRYPDGKTVIVTQNKDHITVFADGRQVTKKADGSVITYEGDGQMEKMHSSGGITHISAMGVRRDILADGTSVLQKPDGTRVVRYLEGDVLETRPDGYSILKSRSGAVQETFPDGRRAGTMPSGASWEVFPDGRTVEVSVLGHRIEKFPDGRREVTMCGVYDYPTRLRPDLVSIEDLPNVLDVGERVQVKGTVVDSAVSVQVLAFGVPDGDVIVGDVHERDGRFESVLEFEETGHYRVQVQVEMAGRKTRTAVHQAVTVGQPDAIVPQTLSVGAYPGDDVGAQILVDLVNDARARLGRNVLKVDRDMMRIAKIRLQEMLAKGEVSHLSTSNEDVRSHMFRERIRFVTVGENVASSNFLETMHEGWMLSAGHRMNILDKRWTYIGVAVTDVGGILWGVEVFAGW